MHVTVDPTVPITSKKALSEEDEGDGAATAGQNKGGEQEEECEGEQEGKDEGDEEDTDPDRIITNARRATLADGHLSIPELTALAAQGPLLKSAYDVAQRRVASPVSCGARYTLAGRRGSHEPMWTSYTHYWKTVLGSSLERPAKRIVTDSLCVDYIMIIDGARSFEVVGFLQPPSTEDLEPGLPRMGVCGSDHVSLMAEIAWFA